MNQSSSVVVFVSGGKWCKGIYQGGGFGFAIGLVYNRAFYLCTHKALTKRSQGNVVIVFDQVQKSYQVGGRAIPALHPTSMTIDTGEVFGIVGHSGAGKSTLVRLINLLEPPTGGRILIDDENITGYNASELRAFRRKVGMIFPVSYTHLTLPTSDLV